MEHKCHILNHIKTLSNTNAEIDILRDLKSQARKGLLIPRSASTALEKACYQSLSILGMKRYGEVFNKQFNPSLELGQYAGEHYYILQEQSEFFKTHIIRDVTQQPFIVDNIDWLKIKFNLLLLIRPIDDVYECVTKREWPQTKKWLTERQDMLITLEDSESFKRLTYQDFIYKPQVLMNILKTWYPSCNKINYLTLSFVKKRRDTVFSIGH